MIRVLRFACTLLTLFLFLGMHAQQLDPNNGLKHWMTPEEAAKRDQIGRDFVITDPPSGVIRNVEEFGPTESVLIRYPFGIPMSLIKEMAKDCKVVTIVASSSQQSSVNSQYLSNGVNTANCSYLIAATDTYWTRDYGPWYITYGENQTGIVDFPYNRPRPNDDEIPKKVAQMQGIEWFGMDVIHTGGNYMTDGVHQSTSTTLVWDENPDLTHDQIAQRIHDYLGITDYMVEPDPNGTYIDHIDCWGKFLAPDKILIRKVPSTHPQYSQIEATAAFYAAQLSAYGTPYRVYRVNTPNNEPYTNSYIENNKVYIPFMGTSYDAGALLAYQQAMPGYQISGYLALPGEPWESTDAMHCRTHEMSDRGMLYIDHVPLSGTLPFQLGYVINADITAFSQQPVYTDSVWVIYKVNNGGFDTLAMVNTSANHYTASIPAQIEGSTIAYYIHAEDASGRSANHPYIGAPDPHIFQVGTSLVPDIVVIPDTLYFNTFEDMYYGKKAKVKNYSLQEVNITYISSAGNNPFSWHLDPWTISLPVTIQPGDSLDLNVKIDIPLSQPEWLCDSLYLTTTTSSHSVSICLNPVLLSKLPSTEDPGNRMNVYPNPVTNRLSFDFEVDKSCYTRLDIFQADGRQVNTLLDEHLDKGFKSLSWNVTDRNGLALQPGIYFYRLLINSEIYTGKFSVVR